METCNSVTAEVHILLNDVVWITLYPSSDQALKYQQHTEKYQNVLYFILSCGRLIKKKNTDNKFQKFIDCIWNVTSL